MKNIKKSFYVPIIIICLGQSLKTSAQKPLSFTNCVDSKINEYCVKAFNNDSWLGDAFSSFKSFLGPAAGSGDAQWNWVGIDPIQSCQTDLIITRKHYPAESWQGDATYWLNPGNCITIQASHTIIAEAGSSTDPDGGVTEIVSFITTSGTTFNGQYDYRAGDAIKLTGFAVDAGNSFKAEIGDCLSATGCGFGTLQPGIYYVRFSDGTNFQVRKVVKL